jgi:hypothetical protein
VKYPYMLWTNLYLGLNGIVYLAFAIWCSVQAKTTSNSLGYELVKGSGQSEYQTVYGGLQAGLGIFFLLGAFNSNFRMPALVMAACIYGGIALARIASFGMFEGIQKLTFIFGTMEIVMAILAFVLMASESRVKAD